MCSWKQRGVRQAENMAPCKMNKREDGCVRVCAVQATWMAIKWCFFAWGESVSS